MSPRRSQPKRIPPKILPATVGSETETTIERIVPGGLGLGYGGGRTLFVSHAAPGDRLRVRIEREQGRIAHAAIVEILEPGPDRVPEPHPLLARCGVDFQHLRYEAQLAIKQEMIADSLRRLGGIELAEPTPITPSPDVWAYRGRVEWRYAPQAAVLGFVESGSRRVIDVPHDPLVVPALADLYAALRARMDAGKLPDWATELRAAAGDDGVSLAPALDLPQPLPVQTEILGERYAYDADCFFQVNPFVLGPLVEEALRFAPDPGASEAETRKAIDLYCGVGLFTLPLARRFAEVIGVEGQPRAADFARRNVEAAGLRQARIEAASAERWLEGAYRSHGRTPFVLLDPPRAGVPAPALRGLLRLRPNRITYVSCDPATLARDLKALRGADYELESVAAIDMFPQTHHVEIVAHLRRAA